MPVARRVQWPIDLEHKPELIRIGEDTQGARADIPVEFWCLPDAWVLHYYTYHASLNLDGEVFRIAPGSLSLTPPGAMARYQFRGKSVHLFATFRLPGAGPAKGGKTARWARAPAMQALGHRAAATEARFRECIDIAREDKLRAEVRLWDILLEAAAGKGAAAKGDAAAPPAFREAVRLIHARIGGPLRVAALAREVGYFYNQLTRLFLKHRGRSVVEYIQARRIGSAKDLLAHTDMTVKAVAAAVGIPDLHHFNKLMKRLTGFSPRRYRTETVGKAARKTRAK